LQLARFDKIIAMKTATGKVVGFHSHNLQVAELDSRVWQTLQNPDHSDAEVQEEILSWNQEIDSSVTDAVVPQKIRTLTVNITQVCNLKCSYCAAGGDGTYGSQTARIDVSKVTGQLDMLLADVPNGGSFAINFLGGEPLIYPEAIRAIARHASLQTAGRQIKLHYEITTNGTLVSARVAELLASIGCHVTVSMDGPPDINDVNRPTRGGTASSTRTLRGIAELFKVQGGLGSLNVHSVFGEHNTQVVRTYEYMRQWDWNMINLSFASGPKDEIYSPIYVDQMNQVADLAYRQGGEAQLRQISQFDQLFRTLDGQQRIHNYCGAGKTLLQVDTEGRFYVCNWFVNDAAEEVGRDLILDQEKLKKYANPLTELNGCGSCWAKHLCGGGCMFVHRARTGDKHKTDAEFCTRTRSLLAKGVEHYAQARQELKI
jgi:uncharacterized protein